MSFGKTRSAIVVLVGVLFSFPAFAQYGQYFSVPLGPPIRIASPPNHAVFIAPVNIPILAYTRPEATFTNVEFFANGTDLGHATRLDVPGRPVTPALAPPDIMGADAISRLHGVWCLVWSNAPAGSYALTAVASGRIALADVPLADDLMFTSSPVNITIVSKTPPINATDVVSIVASDPVAVAGTNNSWAWPGMTNPTPSWAQWPPAKSVLCTNWGPKAALFTVRRCGKVTNTITVNYTIGGTASNGVDYFALPGSVDIQEGYDRAFIPIVPIDRGPAAGPKTVILTLASDTNIPPDYLVGAPSRAEVLLLQTWLRPLPWLLPDGTFHVNNAGPDGAWFYIQFSGDLQHWTCISTNQAFQGSVDFLDPNALSNGCRFYRVVPMTSAPAD